MDLVKIVLTTLKNNLILLVSLVILAIVGGIIHFYSQGISYVSNFKTNQGFVDYTLFKSLTDFNEVSADVYDLSANELETTKELLSKFKVSFVEETAASISFTLVTKEENLDHKNAQEAILKLINHNRFVQNAVDKELKKQREELKFLKIKIAQLDSLLFLPNNPYVSEIPGDTYFLYTQQLNLEEKIASTGRFEIIKPVTNVNAKDRPLLMFVLLYLVLGGFIFLIFSKKPKTNN